MERLLFIIADDRREVYDYAREAFRTLGDRVEVVLDRRAGERRMRERFKAGAAERRQRDERRNQEIHERLRTTGWAVARQAGAPASGPADPRRR